ncbi:MAG TPA: Ku protein [Nitrospirota bacterium]|nr:Ku protein [Nitrospirota bacterium]
MAVQGIWSGTISFSLVAIPVRLVKAVEAGNVSLHILHSKDYSRLSRRMVCPEENVEVTPDEIVRGYELAPGRYIIMTDEELESVSPERSRTIEILDFIDLQELDPVYFDHPYYLVPLKGGEKAYQLMVEVLHRTNKAGIAKFVLAEREHLVAISARDRALALTTLHYSEEVLSPHESAPGKQAADPGLEQRMRTSIERMITDFAPGRYADDRREKLRALLATKIKEHAFVEAPALAGEEESGPADLVAALEESMRKLKEAG